MNKLANVICVPFAGAGASSFSELSRLSEQLTLIPIQLPGREKKFLEPLETNIHNVVGTLAEEAILKIDKSKPTLIFGHSLGAIIAYELARTFSQNPEIELGALIVSGSPGPWNLRSKKATGLPDEAFLKTVQEFANFRHSAMDDPAVIDLVLPILRADVQMHEEYQPRQTEPLSIPIHVVRGQHDTLVCRQEAMAWSRATTLPIDYHELSGGHMYLVDQPVSISSLLEGVAKKQMMTEVV